MGRQQKPCRSYPVEAILCVYAASAKEPKPGDPGFTSLSAPSSSGNIGRFLNQEAIERLVFAHDAGWGYDRLVDLYDNYRLQIQRADPGWSADRSDCSDGSIAFVGTLPTLPNRVPVITPIAPYFWARLVQPQRRHCCLTSE